METVKAFNCELYSLNEYRPPISKTKMTKITKMALKAKKFYKHVVQSVERFIQKCKPEHKVPGLYVIDSIVRRSRNQFGQKDVFGPRFSRNITATFENLQRCPSAEKSKILKVLNLWQKNQVFSSDIMQPLLDTVAGWGSPPVSDASAATSSSMDPADVPGPCQAAGAPPTSPFPTSEAEGASRPHSCHGANLADAKQGHPGQTLLMNSADAIAFVTHMLESPEGQQLVRKLQLQQKRNPQRSLLQALDAGLLVRLQALSSELMPPTVPSTPDRGLSSDTRLVSEMPEGSGKQDAGKGSSQLQTILEPVMVCQSSSSAEKRDLDLEQNHQQPEDLDLCEDHSTVERKTVEFGNEAAESIRFPRKQGSRSPSGFCKYELRDWSATSPGECNSSFSGSCSNERYAREQERGRQKGLPPVRPRTLSVCSSTLRVRRLGGPLDQEDVTSLCEEFGPIESIHMIAPGDCAHVCMVHRADAHRALQKLRAGSREVGSPAVEVSWALNRGVKLEYQQLWDADLGVTYIPWGRVNLHDLAGLAEGGTIDQETVDGEWEAALRNALSREPEGHTPVSLEPGANSNTQAMSPGRPVAEAPRQDLSPNSSLMACLPQRGCAAPWASRGFLSASVVPPAASGPRSESPSILQISQVSVDMVTTDSSVSRTGTLYPSPDTDPQAVVEPNNAMQGGLQGVPASTWYNMGLLGLCPSASLRQADTCVLEGPPGVRRWPLLPPGLHVSSPAPFSAVPRGSRRPSCWLGIRPASPDMVPIDSAIRGHRLPLFRARVMGPKNLCNGRPFLADWRKPWPGPPRRTLNIQEMGGSPWMGPRGFPNWRLHPYCYVPKWSEDGSRGGRRGGRWPARGLVGRQLGPDSCPPRTGLEGDDNS